MLSVAVDLAKRVIPLRQTLAIVTHFKSNRFRWFGTIHAMIATGIAMSVLAAGEGVSSSPSEVDAAIGERQAQAFVEALKPRRPGRPVVAVLALNEGTEITDFLLPHAVLQRAGVADVQAVRLSAAE
jgi:hypothetical protein